MAGSTWCAGVLVPDRQLVPLEPDRGGGGPPDLVIGGGQDPAQLGPGHGPTHGDVDVRGEPPLGSTAAKYCTS